MQDLAIYIQEEVFKTSSKKQKPVPYWNTELEADSEIGPNLRRPSKLQKTTMSVCDMGKLLGLKKTESYWLLHKGFFKTHDVNGKTRIDIADFERWYANQVKYHKVDGTLPGEQLKQNSYSAADIADMLGLSEPFAYELINQYHIETVIVDYQKRVPKEVFEKWYSSQSRYRTAQDRERDKEAEENSIWLPDLARMLGIHRNSVYYLAQKKSEEGIFEIITIGDRKRVTKDSFYRWYEGQTHYKLLTEEEMAAAKAAKEKEAQNRKKSKLPKKAKQLHLREPKNPGFYTMDEIVEFYGIARSTISYWLKSGQIPGVLVGRSLRIPKDEFDDWLDYKNC